MDFPLLNDAKVIIIKFLSQFGLKLVDRTTEEVLRSYFNLKHKWIMQRPRQIFVSDKVREKAVQFQVEHVLTVIEHRFTDGGDINPFLSKGIFRLDNHDYLLNDWSIHHLHLNNKKAKPTDYFHERSDQLLFAYVNETEAYLIDIRQHNENYVFAQRDLLGAIRDNWPELNRKLLVKDEPMEIYPKFEEWEIDTMRRKGYIFSTQVEDHVYHPGVGSACTGFSLKAGMEMNQFMRDLHKIHCYVKEHKNELKHRLSGIPNVPLQELQVSLVFKDWLFYPYEIHSQQFLNIDL